METYDVIIIGAGHNALVCASYLLKAGYKVLGQAPVPPPGEPRLYSTNEASQPAPSSK